MAVFSVFGVCFSSSVGLLGVLVWSLSGFFGCWVRKQGYYESSNFVFLFTPVFLAMFWLSILFPALTVLLGILSLNVIFLYGSIPFWIFSVLID